MPRANSYPTRMKGASGAATYRGEPREAPQAKGCRCREHGYEPWLERQDDGAIHCCRCGSDFTRGVR